MAKDFLRYYSYLILRVGYSDNQTDRNQPVCWVLSWNEKFSREEAAQIGHDNIPHRYHQTFSACKWNDIPEDMWQQAKSDPNLPTFWDEIKQAQ